MAAGAARPLKRAALSRLAGGTGIAGSGAPDSARCSRHVPGVENTMNVESKKARRLTRRHVLKSSAAALGGGAALLGGSTPALAAQAAQGPAVLTGTQTGRAFRGLVRHGTTLDVQEMRLLPIDPRQVVIRSSAVAPCYTIVRGALGTTEARR